MIKTLRISSALALLLLAGPGFADEASDISLLQTRWAEIKYAMPEQQQETQYATLVEQARTLREANPSKASYLIWEGIVRSTYAGAKGGLGALGEVKQAKVLFEDAIRIDPAALDGSAYTSLGSLYYQVPGWPLGFGDDDEADRMLKKGLELNPEGIDSNFFYGDYLLEEKKYPQALAAFEKALQAPARPGRESADAGRRTEINARIAEVKDRM